MVVGWVSSASARFKNCAVSHEFTGTVVAIGTGCEQVMVLLPGQGFRQFVA